MQTVTDKHTKWGLTKILIFPWRHVTHINTYKMAFTSKRRKHLHGHTGQGEVRVNNGLLKPSNSSRSPPPLKLLCRYIFKLSSLINSMNMKHDYLNGFTSLVAYHEREVNRKRWQVTLRMLRIVIVQVLVHHLFMWYTNCNCT